MTTRIKATTPRPAKHLSSPALEHLSPSCLATAVSPLNSCVAGPLSATDFRLSVTARQNHECRCHRQPSQSHEGRCHRQPSPVRATRAGVTGSPTQSEPRGPVLQAARPSQSHEGRCYRQPSPVRATRAGVTGSSTQSEPRGPMSQPARPSQSHEGRCYRQPDPVRATSQTPSTGLPHPSFNHCRI